MNSPERLREHPEDRLSPPIQVINLAESAARLRGESHPAVAGHRQIAVFRSGPVTLVHFLFDADGELKEHRADGVVTIHVLAGQLIVSAEGVDHALSAGAVIAFGPGVPHGVRARDRQRDAADGPQARRLDSRPDPALPPQPGTDRLARGQ